MPNENLKEMRCTIKRMFNGCPKPSGWFGCFASVRGESDDIRLFGTANIPLTEKMVLDVKARPSVKYDGAWDAVEITPVTKTRTGMVSYLCSFPGVSRMTARRLVERYGIDVIDVIKTSPDRLTADLGISGPIKDSLVANVCDGDRLNQLRQFLPEFSAQLTRRINETLTDPIAEIRDDPYKLCSIPGVSFASADTVALRLGVEPLSPYRVNHGLIHVLGSDSGNDMFVDLNDPRQVNRLTATVERLLHVRLEGQNELSLRSDALAAIKDSPVVIECRDGQKRLFLTETHTALRTVTDYIRRNCSRKAFPHVPSKAQDASIANAITMYQNDTGMALTKEQATAVRNSVKSMVSVITGGPGRGKTTIVDCLAKCVKYGMGLDQEVVLLAPTGRAMNKLRTATKGQYQTMTIDRLIVSSRNEHSKLRRLNKPDTLFIVDESSMLTVVKMAEMIDIFDLARYCFVGDVDQLPPIGQGRFLSDVIATGKVKTSVLTTPLRNGGVILSNAAKIAAGDRDLQWDFVSMPFFPQSADDQDALQFILEQYNEERENCPDITDLALLCPIKKGAVGVQALNMAIQRIACPENPCQPVTDARRMTPMYTQKGHPIQATIYGNGQEWTRFRVGDIVMNTKNQYELRTVKYQDDDYWNGLPTDTANGLFNGECGRIIAFAPDWSPAWTNGAPAHDYIVIQLFDGRVVEIDVTLGEFESFELGYAMTVHKAQGCEYDTVIYVTPDAMTHMTASGFSNRNVVYTAATRAKQRVVVIGSKDSLYACIDNPLPAYNTDFTERV